MGWAIFAFRLAAKPLLTYCHSPSAIQTISVLLWLSAIAWGFRLFRGDRSKAEIGFWFALAALIVARILTVKYSPNPFIDVYTGTELAVRFF